MPSRYAAVLLAAALPAASLAAEPAKYPAKPVRFVVPYAPGGGSDITARAIGQKLGDALGHTFVVDSRPGASGLVGTELVAKSPADGYTLILADSAHTINNVIYQKPRYDAIRDFAPITLVATTPLALMAHPALQPSLRELIAMPDIPTFQEAGLSDMAVLLWYGVLAPAGTPKDIVALLNREIARTLQAPDVRERFAALALDKAPGGPDEFRQLLERELKIWRSVIAQSNEPLQ